MGFLSFCVTIYFMKIRRVEESISLNLASLLGYPCFAFTFFFFAVIVTAFNRLDKQSPEDGWVMSMTWIAYMFGFYRVQLIIALILILLATAEFALKKRGKSIKIGTSKIPAILIKIHPYIFWLGIFLVFIPFYLLVLYGLSLLL
jgi:hypothetical protein